MIVALNIIIILVALIPRVVTAVVKLVRSILVTIDVLRDGKLTDKERARMSKSWRSCGGAVQALYHVWVAQKPNVANVDK
jgi:hypothetical protein